MSKNDVTRKSGASVFAGIGLSMERSFPLKLERLVFFVLLAVVPIIFNTSTHDGYLTVKRVTLYVLASMLAVIWSARWAAGQETCARGTFPKLLLLFGLFSMASFFSAENKPDWFFGFLLRVSTLFLAYWAFARLRTTRLQVTFAAVLTGAGFLVSTYGLFQFSGWDWVDFADPEGARAFAVSTFGNQNYVAEFLIAAIPAAVSLCFYLPSIRWKKICGAAAAVMFLHLLIGRCRGGWLALLIGSALGLLFALRHPTARESLRRGRRLFLTIGAAAAVCLAVFLCTSTGQAAAKRAASVFDPASSTNRTRILIWSSTVEMIQARPFLGVGLGNYEQVYPAYRSDEDRLRHGWGQAVAEAHNDWLQIAAESGLPAFLAFLALVVWACGGMLRSVAAQGKNFMLSAGHFAGLTAILLQAGLGFPLHHPVGAVVFWALLGVGVGIAEGTKDQPVGVAAKARSTFAGGLRIACVCLAATFFFVAIALSALLLAASVERRFGDAARMRGQWEAALSRYARAMDFAPWDWKLRMDYGRALHENQRFEPAIAQYDEVLKRNPRHEWVRRHKADALRDAGETANALSAYAAALRCNPTDAAVFIERGLLHLARKNYESAEADFRAAAEDPGTRALAFYNLGVVRAEQGNWPGVRFFLEESLRLNPNDGAAMTNLGWAYEALNLPAAAAREYETALRFDAEPTLALRNLRRLTSARSELKKALPYWRCLLARNRFKDKAEPLLREWEAEVR
jgi:putative inorganic carbon (HCO3(-)) transporter